MIDATDKTFDKLVLENKETVIAMFYATYCHYCKRFLPIFENNKNIPHITFVLIDITNDSNPLWEKYNIDRVPTIVAFKDGKEIGRRNSASSIGLIEADLENLLRDINSIINKTNK